MGHLIVLVGNIGTGKTEYRKKHFNNGEVIICPDEWGLHYASQIGERIESLVKGNLSAGLTVVVDGNNVGKNIRNYFLGFARGYDSKATIIDFGKGNKKSLERRIQSSPNLTRLEWEEKHLNYQSEYERPDEDEMYDEIIRANED